MFLHSQLIVLSVVKSLQNVFNPLVLFGVHRGTMKNMPQYNLDLDELSQQ